MPKPAISATRAEASNVVIVPARRRSSIPAEKFLILRAADACLARGDIEAMLRHEGIFNSPLSMWSKALAQHGVEGFVRQSNFLFHPSLLGEDRLGKFDDHNWKLFGDH